MQDHTSSVSSRERRPRLVGRQQARRAPLRPSCRRPACGPSTQHRRCRRAGRADRGTSPADTRVDAPSTHESSSPAPLRRATAISSFPSGITSAFTQSGDVGRGDDAARRGHPAGRPYEHGLVADARRTAAAGQPDDGIRVGGEGTGERQPGVVVVGAEHLVFEQRVRFEGDGATAPSDLLMMRSPLTVSSSGARGPASRRAGSVRRGEPHLRPRRCVGADRPTAPIPRRTCGTSPSDRQSSEKRSPWNAAPSSLTQADGPAVEDRQDRDRAGFGPRTSSTSGGVIPEVVTKGFAPAAVTPSSTSSGGSDPTACMTSDELPNRPNPRPRACGR